MNTPENPSVNSVSYPDLANEPVPSAPQPQDISIHPDQANPNVTALILKTAQFSQQLACNQYDWTHAQTNNNKYVVTEPSDDDHATTSSTTVNITITDITACAIL